MKNNLLGTSLILLLILKMLAYMYHNLDDALHQELHSYFWHKLYAEVQCQVRTHLLVSSSRMRGNGDKGARWGIVILAIWKYHIIIVNENLKGLQSFFSMAPKLINIISHNEKSCIASYYRKFYYN